MKTSYRTALYAGSFDPFTNGHLWLVSEACKMFDKVIVAVADNPSKKPLFTAEERVAMIQESVSSSVIVTTLQGATVRYAAAVGAGILVRGIRNQIDYAYEQGMNCINTDLEPGVRTVFLMPPAAIAHVSSSIVRESFRLAGCESTVKKYVPSAVFHRLMQLRERA